MTDMRCPVCGEMISCAGAMHQCGKTFEGDRDDLFTRMDYSLDDAVCDAQDNLPGDWQLTVTFAGDQWSLACGKPGIGGNGFVVFSDNRERMGLTEAIVKAIDFAREREGLPT